MGKRTRSSKGQVPSSRMRVGRGSGKLLLALGGFLLSGGPPWVLAQACPTWVDTTTTGPPPRQGHAMAYDSARGVTVLFGGRSGQAAYCGDTWEWTRPNYVLAIDVVNPAWGSVDVDPFAAGYEYPACTEVTLHALSKGKNSLRHWVIYDPNHCGDVNHAVFDSNDATTIIMDSDKCVTAVFRCGSGIQPLLPLMLGLLGLLLLLRRGRGA